MPSTHNPKPYLRWFLLEYGYKQSMIFHLNGFALVACFCLVRILVGCSYSYIFWSLAPSLPLPHTFPPSLPLYLPPSLPPLLSPLYRERARARD